LTSKVSSSANTAVFASYQNTATTQVKQN